MAQSIVALNDVVVRHGGHTALQIPALAVQCGEVLVILGPNGAGKSTLLRVIGLLQRPDQGDVALFGKSAQQNNSLKLRRRVATVFQEPLLLNSTVYDNVALGLRLRGTCLNGDLHGILHGILERHFDSEQSVLVGGFGFVRFHRPT